jgi:hypothetical protein
MHRAAVWPSSNWKRTNGRGYFRSLDHMNFEL